jgi:thiol-disulfide isomerase/thioredoxin/YHS domain-containing protein
MNYLSRVFACIFLLSSSVCFGQIQWVSDPNDAAKIAQQTGKPILLHFYTESCPPCKMLEYRAFRDPEFVRVLSESVIPVKVNAEEQREFTANYGVTRWPTDVYLFPDGTELHRTVSPQDPVAYGEVMQRVSMRCRDSLIEKNSRYIPEKTHGQARIEALNLAQQQSSDPSTVPPIVAPEKKVAARTASYQMPSRISHEPPKHSARELPAFASTAPSHTLVASHRQEVDASQSSGNAGSQDPQSAQSSAKPKINRYRTQSANFSSSFTPVPPNPALPPPAQIHSPFISQPGNQGSPSLQMATVSQQKSLLVNNSSSENAGSPSVSAAPENLAIDGFCPVILDEKRWELGSAQFAVRHRGKIYHCSSEAARSAFLADPDRYSPMLSGYDVVRFLENGQVVNGKRQFGCWFGGRVYLFESEITRQIFDKNVERYLQQLQSLQDSAGRVATESNDAVYR